MVSLLGCILVGAIFSGCGSDDQSDPPDAPASIGATRGTYSDRVYVEWTPSAGATSYEVWRADANSSTLAVLLGSTTSVAWNDSTSAALDANWYFVRAVNDDGDSDFSPGAEGWRGAAASGGAPADDPADDPSDDPAHPPIVIPPIVIPPITIPIVAPTLVSPADGSTVSTFSVLGRDVTFTWAAVLGADIYILDLDGTQYATDGTSMTRTLSLGSHTWHVHAKAPDAILVGPASDTRTVTVTFLVLPP